jgi:hypothetical protein
MRESVEGPWVSSQDEDDGAYRARLLVDELASDCGDDRWAIQAVFAGVMDFAVAQDMPPYLIADEFLIQLRSWIKDRDRQEAETIQALMRATRRAER